MPEVRKKDKDPTPTVISTFAGCGGSSLGYRMAGYRELLAVEWDKDACETFRLNFPGVPLWAGDIKDLSVDKALEMSGMSGPGELDVLDGSPPCQGFSAAGVTRKNKKDIRNFLFLEYVRLLRGLNPKVFIMENVLGMAHTGNIEILREIFRQLGNSGYSMECRKLNSKWFGVPQSRGRLIFIGIRNDLKVELSYPKAIGSPIPIRYAFERDGVPLEAERKWVIEEGTKSKILNRMWDKIILGRSFAATFEKVTGVYAGKFFQQHKLDPNRPIPTVTTTAGYFGLSMYMHWSDKRILTLSEFKSASSFPNEFMFPEEKEYWKQDNARLIFCRSVKQLGNAVLPLMMRAIAEHVKREILWKMPKR